MNDRQQPARTLPPELSRRYLLRRLCRGGLGIVGAALLGACGLATEGDRKAVMMTFRQQYTPTGMTVRRGTTVVWANRDTRRHTATCDPSKLPQGVTAQLPSGAQPWDSGDLYPGQTWAYAFTTPGQYVYACRYAGATGMIGTITVAE